MLQDNDTKPRYVIDHVKRLAGQFAMPKIGCLGLTYKADVDDLRESPSLEIARGLQEAGIGDVLACDPYLTPERVPELTLYELSDVLAESNILVLLTDHRQFHDLSPRILQEKVVVDTRGVWR